MLNLEKMNLVELNAQEVIAIDGGKNWFQKNWDSFTKDINTIPWKDILNPPKPRPRF
jgi:hypothetical protein